VSSGAASFGAPHQVPGGVANPYGYGPGGMNAPFASPYGAGPRYAGFWQRLGALLLDSAIIGVPFSAFGFVYLHNAPTRITSCTVNGRPGLCEVPTNGAIALIILVSVVGYLAGVVFYYGLMEGRTGQTIGKRVTGIKTVGRQTGQPLGVGRAIGRSFAHLLSGFLCYLGYFWMLWDDQKQTWHDKITDAIVVEAGT
jgi:uncharacterized RDD family membrane protein YckC